MRHVLLVAAILLAVAAGTHLALRANARAPRPAHDDAVATSEGVSAGLSRATTDPRLAAGLPRSDEATGRVIAFEGGPLAGAKVSPMSLGDDAARAAFGNVAGVATDAEGRFRVRGVPRGWGLVASAIGFLSRLVIPDPLGGPTEIALRKPDGRIEGSVRDVHGGAVAGAYLQVGDAWKGLGVARSDVEGHFALPVTGSTDGEAPWVAVWAAGFAPWNGAASTFDADSVGHLDVVLEPGTLLSVRVSDAETGAPVAGAIVVQGNSPAGEAKTDEAGMVEFHVAPDVVIVDLTADGYSDRSGDIERVEGGMTGSVEVRLQPFVRYEGVVLDESGAPLAGADVFVLRGRPTVSGRDGRFRTTGPPPGTGSRDFALFGARCGSRSPAFARVDEAHRTAIELRLGAPSILQGVVVDGSGAPLPAVRVSMTPSGTDAILGHTIGYLDLLYDSQGVPARLDGAGRFRVDGLPPGTWHLYARANAVSPSGTVETPVEVRAGETTWARIVLDASVSLRGRVTNESGAPVKGARIRCTLPSRDFEDVHTDAAGDFLVEGLPDRPFRMSVYAKDYADWGDRVDPHDGEVRVVLEDPPAETRTRIRVVLSGLDVKTLGLTARLFPAGDPRAALWPSVRVEGPYAFVESGTVWPVSGLRLFGSTAYGEAPSFEVRAGQETMVAIEMHPLLGVAGVVRDTKGDPLEGAWLVFSRDGPDERAWGIFPSATTTIRTDANGRFTAAGFPPCDVSIRISKEGFATENVRAGAGRSDLAFALEPAGEIEFSVAPTGGDPEPPPRVEVEVSEASVSSGFSARLARSADGTFGARLPAGAYLAAAVRGARRGPEVRVTVARGERVGPISLDPPPISPLAVKGRVLDPAGDPSKDGMVLLTPKDRDASATVVRIGEGGRFLAEDVLAGRYRVAAMSRGSWAEAADVAAGTKDLLLTLAKSGEVRGRVTGPWTTMPRPLDVRLVRADGVPGSTPARVTKDGSFDAESMPPGAYRVVARAGAYVGTTRDAVTVAADGVVRGVQIAMETGATVVATYVDEAGNPIAGGTLTCSAHDLPSPPTATTDADGSCRFEGLLPGSWLVFTSGESFSSSRIEVSTGTATLHLAKGRSAPRGR